jgi:hypothetical protein
MPGLPLIVMPAVSESLELRAERSQHSACTGNNRLPA